MALAYNTIDADGHILEPLELWENYIDPKFPNAGRGLRLTGTARSG